MGGILSLFSKRAAVQQTCGLAFWAAMGPGRYTRRFGGFFRIGLRCQFGNIQTG